MADLMVCMMGMMMAVYLEHLSADKKVVMSDLCSGLSSEIRMADRSADLMDDLLVDVKGLMLVCPLASLMDDLMAYYSGYW